MQINRRPIFTGKGHLFNINGKQIKKRQNCTD